jgi:hypothetical protein
MEGSARVDENLIAEFEQVKKRQKISRILTPVILLTIVFLNIWSMYNIVFGMDQDAYSAELEKRQHRVEKASERDLGGMVGQLSPIFDREFQKQSPTLNEKLGDKLMAENETMKKNVERHFHAKLDRGARLTRNQRRGILARHGVKNKRRQDNILDAVDREVNLWMMDQLNNALKAHNDAMIELHATVQKYYAGKGDKKDPNAALGLWLELMNDTWGGDESILARRPAKRKKRRNR